MDPIINKYRVVVTTNCSKGCEYCCNKQFGDFSDVPVITKDEIRTAKELIITGGEPLYCNELGSLIRYFHALNEDAKIYIHTARVNFDNSQQFDPDVMLMITGITLTLHTLTDIFLFTSKSYNRFQNRGYSLILKNMTEFAIPIRSGWIYKDVEIIDKCPVPSDQKLVKLLIR